MYTVFSVPLLRHPKSFGGTMTRLLALALAVLPAAAFAQQTHQLQLPMASRTLEFHIASINGYNVDGSARGVEGLDYSAGASVSAPHDLPVIHRVILDRTHHLYFGYDLTLTPADAPNRVRLHFAPLSDLRGFHFDPSAFQPGSMDVPDDRSANLGEAVQISLEINAKDETVLHDTLRVTNPQ